MARPGNANRAEWLPANLLGPACYPHPVRRVRLLETHISWILLTGDYAYKVNKPVNLGFLDFTTLERRRQACEEEWRLNRRLAPELYLDVVEIRGTSDAPRIGGDGPLLEYAIKMREFPQKALASRTLARGRFGAAAVDDLAAGIAVLHARAPAATPGRLGAPQTILAAARQNFDQMLPRVKRAADRGALDALRRWTEREFAARRQAMAARKQVGFVRECHGDLHLGNVALLDGRPVPFDGIGFNAELSWIDVLSDVAFLFMDLADRGRPDLGWRFVNRYLEATGDYGGLDVLRFYAVYRAVVRAKIHLIRAQQPGLPRREGARLMRAFRSYRRLAQRLAAPGRPAIVIAHGLSGSGKTTATQPLLEALGAVRVRSDIERKRMHGYTSLATSASAPGAGIYSRKANSATYRRLGVFARDIVRAGYPAVVDAAFLRRTEREAFRALAAALDAPFVILNFRVPLAQLRERVAARRNRGDDASEADLGVLERQIARCEPLTPAEMQAAVNVDGTRPPDRQTRRTVIALLAGRRAGGIPRLRGTRKPPPDLTTRGTERS